MGNKKTKFTLIENAKDSLEHAVEHLTTNIEPTTSDLKRAILDVSHVVELVLKERIRRIHPAFIWDNIDKYPSPTAYLIGTPKSIHRLLNLVGIALSNDEKQTLIDCRTIRNKIEHYEFEIHMKETKAIVGRMLSFIFDFSKRYLDIDLESDFKKDDRWSTLIDIHEFYEAHSSALEKRMHEEDKSVHECPSCRASTYDLSIMRCTFCGHSEDLIQCDYCNELIPESDIEITEEVDVEAGSYNTLEAMICRDCINKSMARDTYLEDLREMNRGI